MSKLALISKYLIKWWMLMIVFVISLTSMFYVMFSGIAPDPGIISAPVVGLLLVLCVLSGVGAAIKLLEAPWP